MNDHLTELDRVLQAKAAEVPQFQHPPQKMLARARRRIIRNALSSVVVAGIFVVGISGLAGLRTLPERVPPASSGPHPLTPAPSSPSCTAAELRATARLEGAAGSVLGSIDLTNLGDRTCTLTGRPTVMLFDPAGHEVSVHVVPVSPQWQADGASPPDGWPVVTLGPGSAAAIRVRWANACPQLSDPVRWNVDLGGGMGTLDVSGADAIFPPPCNGPTEPSTLEVGPFEPSSGV
jgi:uncharacterized protein DUF4232